ncbi:MAG: efflux RND transporter periplasmic adaptor subunit [Verrucomicrobiota bacterium]
MKIIYRTLLIAALLMAMPACGKKSGSGKPSDVDYYTCTMHPSVHSETPGKCPICSMELVPVMKKNVERKSVERGATPNAKRSEASRSTEMPGMPGMKGGAETKAPQTSEFVVPVERQQQIGVTYATVERKPLQHSIRAVGMVETDLQRHWAFVARVEGYVQQLFVTSPGEIVEKNAPLMSIYSPELVTTQRELVMLLHMRDEAKRKDIRETPARLVDAAKVRLEQWNMTGDQIAELEKNRKPAEFLTLRSPFRGVVQEVPARQGVAVRIGDHLVDVADLSVVWVWSDFYESELSMLKQGQKITVTTGSYPNEKFEGEIALINPFLDPAKRTSRVRIDIPNPDFKLRPGMYANVELTMNMGEGLAIPVGAVMPTGRRNVAFVDKGEGRLEPRIVELGEGYGNFYAVKSGLSEHERVVASANFLIDAESKVQGALKDFEERGAESGEREAQREERAKP